MPGPKSAPILPPVSQRYRGDSEDSRVFGPIEISKVVGRAWLRYWPADSFGILSNPNP